MHEENLTFFGRIFPIMCHYVDAIFGPVTIFVTICILQLAKIILITFFQFSQECDVCFHYAYLIEKTLTQMN